MYVVAPKFVDQIHASIHVFDDVQSKFVFDVVDATFM